MHKRARNHRILVEFSKSWQDLNHRHPKIKIKLEYKHFMFGYEPQGKRLN